MSEVALCAECDGRLPAGYRIVRGQTPLCSPKCRRLSHRKSYKKWYDNNRESEAERRLVNKSSSPDYFKDHYAKNSAKRKEQSRSWYAANKARARQKQREYVAENPDVIRRCSFKASHKRRSIAKKVFVEHVDPHVVFDRDAGQCGICKKPVQRDSPWEIDHVIPISKGGAHAYANVQLAHQSCNRAKRDRVPVGQPTLFQVVV